MINKVTLIGNLGKDPEIRHLEGGTAVVKFSVATSENYRDRTGEWRTETEWHDVVAWRQLAEKVARELHKGSLVFIEGKLTHRKWTDKEGHDRYATEVLAQTIRSLDKRENNGGTKSYQEAPATNRAEFVPPPPPAQSGEPDDLPF